MRNIINFFKKEKISNPPYDYYFLLNLEKHEYPEYLAKLFYQNTGEKLPLKNGVIDKKKLKTFNQKIQWIKLYGVTDLMRDCTDKVKVRDYVKEKIGEEYLKPVLQIIPNESKETMRCHCEQVNDNSGLARQSTDICQDTPDCHDTQNEVVSRLRFPKFQFRENWVLAEYNDRESNAVSTYFDKIDFNKLPDSFVIKTNHGSKWQYIIKNKEKYLKNEQLIDLTKYQITNWLSLNFGFFCGFELNYQNIEPKILIEPLMREQINIPCDEIQVFCFSGKPELFARICGFNNNTSLYDGKLNVINDTLFNGDNNIEKSVDDLIKQTYVLSEKLAHYFQFVRIDWMIYKNKVYFEELTFTPYSGFQKNINKKFNIKLGKLMKI